ncbi:MAG TPA: [FeFe] hydrogenase H-cluster radical SAM maturase HydG [Alkalispirochaeta sp.]|nr:[FeFe] hydrogenase H-cluster radical SAM maturase HydG [Alkalispirochaeta sp.]
MMTAARAQELAWAESVIKPEEIDKYLDSAGRDFIDDDLIYRQLADAHNPDPQRVRDILDKSRAMQTLDPSETATLLQVEDPDLLDEMRQTGLEIKLSAYDNRIVTFAPLYMSNHCINSCTYCGFRQENHEMERVRLTPEEIRRETRSLTGTFGHKRLIVVYGEHPKSDIDYLEESIDAVYGVRVPTRKGHANIRRVNVNAAPLDIASLRRLKNVGLGTFQVFQETYHRDTYRRVHGHKSLKADYKWRLYCMHRAQDAEVDDVGIGVLFGLYDWKFEVMGLVNHTRELEKTWRGIGPHTISFPRLEAAHNAPGTRNSPYAVSDADFLKLITVLRLSVPYTGMICTARETAAVRNEAVRRGITQMDASTRIGLGAYSSTYDEQEEARQQFMLGDPRSVDELVYDLADMGYITSFCTAGYRIGRTGERIMRLLRSCHEGDFCKLNAILTFREWLDDFATPATKEKGEMLIRRELATAAARTPKLHKKFSDYYERTIHGARDLYL